ncbi:MAG: bifunctional diaminohydroxyphosphoribosylaminopyrimidine deaminase/5-amino-6-(5-phosphoribosylamino)uracil reductase RibD [Paludibacteraceae bacterium]|nr:bifunctional diaminohydroxyphosphoribosylaminopyrimidine deaminase/5-amino-6-(5-phosphoribosylamino)uracil reductase RibD [Paludibacteraceae bacterium]
MLDNETYMFRCLQLAKQGLGNVAPNPMVGAVIVANGRIIGEGFHRRCGEAHAEVNAINSVKETHLLPHSTLYVNLEPCSHYGKTPPCAKLIIEKKIPHVVVGSLDPFPEVAGRGIKMLREAGVSVEVGILQKECDELNKRFFTFHRKKRPFVLLKFAQSADGFCAKNGEETLLSTPQTQLLVHKLRTEESAILVGKNTALIDNPKLNARYWNEQKNPIRMVVDKNLEIPKSNYLFDQSQPTIVFTQKKQPSSTNLEFVELNFSENIVPQICDFLYQRNIQSLIVEGGPTLQQSFIDAKIVDEVRIEISPKILENGIKIPAIQISIIKEEVIDGNKIITAKPIF